MGKLSPAEFEKIYGVSIEPRKISAAEIEEEQVIYRLFDLMRDELDMREHQIFREAGESEALHSFLKSVRTCPETILTFCRAALQPNSPERLRYAAAKAKGRPA